MNIQELEDEFYSKKLYHSYSSLSKLLYSPALFYKEYVLQQKEPSIGRHLSEGKLIHSLMLDKENFDDLFIIAPSGLPSDNTLKVINHVWDYHKTTEGADTISLGDYAEIIIDKLQEMELHQSLKTDEQRVAKIVNDVSNEYWEFLKKKEGREIVDIEMLDKCQEYADVLKSNNAVMGLLTGGEHIYNEILIKADLDAWQIGIKGILDNVCVDETNKVIKVNDIKTTSKSIKDFPESVEFWNYWIQERMYATLISKVLSKHIEEGYTYQFHFIVIDPYKQVYCFGISDDTREVWQDRFNLLLEEADWHFVNRNYTLPSKFIKNKIWL